jgi:hypothetical protein
VEVWKLASISTHVQVEGVPVESSSCSILLSPDLFLLLEWEFGDFIFIEACIFLGLG